MSTSVDTAGQSRTAKRAAQRRGAAARSRRHREARRESGTPSLRDAQRALAEATAYAMRSGVMVDGRVMVDATLLRDAALIILVRDGHRLAPSARVVAKLLAPRVDHSITNNIPSTAGAWGGESLRPPRRRTQWTEAELRILERVMTIMPDPLERHRIAAAKTPETYAAGHAGRVHISRTTIRMIE